MFRNSVGLLALMSLYTFLDGVRLIADDGSVPASLTIGSRAPELDIEHWVTDGQGKFPHVKKFEPGNVYLVEFWATWCGPCIGSMPDLAKLQEQYRDQGVQVISISDEELGEVTEFMKLKADVPQVEGAKADQTYGELTSGYCLTTDPDRSVYVDYMEASGQRGIPSAFLVGKSGEIEWMGSPYSLEENLAVAKVLDGSWDRAAHLAEIQLWHTWGLFCTQAKKLVEKQEYNAARELYAQQREALRVQFLNEPILLDQLKEFETDLEEDILLAPALRHYKAKDYVAYADELEKALVQANEKQKSRVNFMRFLIMMKLKRYSPAMDLLIELSHAEKPDAHDLNHFCWRVYEETQVDGAVVPAALITAALAGSEIAVKSTPQDCYYLDTLAHLNAATGNWERAIELETQAVELEADAEAKAKLEQALKALLERESGLKSKN